MYKIVSFFISVIITLCSFFGISVQRKPLMLNETKLVKNITSSQEARLASGKLTGAQIIVKQNGQALVDDVFGKKSAEGEALSGNETYRIASMTKPITALALLIEQDRGHLNVNDDVADYLPEFREMYVKCEDGSVRKAENPIKVYMLVAHNSGIDEPVISGETNPIPMSERTVETMTDYIATMPLAYEPGTAQAYNTVAFDVAARIIEKLSGMDFEEYLKVNIFDKLGMTDTTFVPSAEQFDRMVAIHGMEDGKAVDLPSVPGCVFANYPPTYYVAGGGLMSTASDYSKFAEMLLNGGKAEDGTVIVSEEMIRLMATPVVDDSIMPGSQKWGLGVRVITDGNYTLPEGTFGWSGAYGTHFWVDPVNKITAVYMKNSGYDGGAGAQTANELEEDVMRSFSFKSAFPVC